MPQLYTYVDQYIGDAEGLGYALSPLIRDRIITSSHKQTIEGAITPLLPCQVRIGVRTPLSVIYCEAAQRMFRVGQRGQFIPGAWPANMKSKRYW